MSKLEELINTLCSSGVEYKILGDICSITTGKLNANARSENGLYPFFTCNEEPYTINEYAFDMEAIFISGNGNIGHINYYNGKFNAYQRTYILYAFTNIEVGYLIHYLKYKFRSYALEHTKMGSVPYIVLSTVQNFQIPVPPIEVQREIVRVLDNITELTADITAEITAELTARKKQYEYYRDELLDYIDKKDVEFKPVSELFDFKNGLNKGKEFFGKGVPIVNFTDVFKNRWLTGDMLKGRVDLSKSEIDRYSAKKGDVFFTRTSETQEEIGMTSVLLDSVQNCVFSGFVLRARPKTNLLLPKFCSYFFSTTYVRKQIIQKSTFTTRALTSGPKLSSILVPILSLEKQEHIVDILDKFHSLLTDISQGLPAEIEARKKQYEYYRDKLLTFKEKSE